MPRPLRWAVADAMLEDNEHKLLPVSDSAQTDLMIRITQVSYRTADGSRQEVKDAQHMMQALRNPDGGPCTRATDISMICTISKDGTNMTVVSLNTALLPTGWIDRPHVLLDDAQPTGQ